MADFVAKTQNPSVHDPRFEVFTTLIINDFMNSDRDDLLLCPIRALRKYFLQMEQFHPVVS